MKKYTLTLLIFLSSCQSVDYYDKSYEDNNFLYCMVLDHTRMMQGDVSERDNEKCINYESIITSKFASANSSILNRVKLLQKYGASCVNQQDYISCTYSQKAEKVGPYFHMLYGKYVLYTKLYKDSTYFNIDIKSCDENFKNCTNHFYDRLNPNSNTRHILTIE